ncbi:MAG TPA: CopD family protein [Chitinophagaceae bacterium]|nr:CopD family protein [Chitinophagaceae bacterium]
MYNYIKALHVIFVVTWFAGMFYIVRLFIYHTEAAEKPEPDRGILQQQFAIMIKRLWLGITWPSAVLTSILGPVLWSMLNSLPQWLAVKLIFVLGLYLYHFSLHILYKQQLKGFFKFSSQQLRIWNEVATIFLVAIVMLAVVKQSLSFFWGLMGLLGIIIILMSAIKIYKNLRKPAEPNG